jgi:BirA family biotin operon repressor/biotin-[acetyl-CoA-carboxylase] ligase
MIASRFAGATMAAFDLLRELADGEFHSGQDLAERHGVSRTAIWKKIASLQALGLDIERVRGRGYRVSGGVDLLDAATIRDHIEPGADDLLHNLLLFPEVDSTNAELQRRGAPAHGAAVCLAESQSAGRGRRGRHWVSPFGSSIYLSVVWQFQGGAEVLEGLSLAVGVVLAEAIAAMGVPQPALKWPNDLYLDGAKAAGILVELSGDLSGPCTAIIGIGINVRLPAAPAAQIDQPWSDLQTAASAPVSRNVLAAGVINRLLPLLARYEEQGFASWRERWQALHAHAGKPVIVEQGGRRLAGIATGVDAQGALLLHTDSGIHALRGGEVSLRPAP